MISVFCFICNIIRTILPTERPVLDTKTSEDIPPRPEFDESSEDGQNWHGDGHDWQGDGHDWHGDGHEKKKKTRRMGMIGMEMGMKKEKKTRR